MCRRASYISHGRKVGGSRRSRKSASSDGTQMTAMRAWLRDNGHEVSTRGRIPQQLQDLYHNSR
jgi:hypothetical protein